MFRLILIFAVLFLNKVVFFYVVWVISFVHNLSDEGRVNKHIVNRCMWWSENLSLSEMMLQSLDVMWFPSVMLADILLKGRATDLAAICLLNHLKSLSECLWILSHDIEAHLEDIVHFKLISEALLLMIGIDVAQCLTTR